MLADAAWLRSTVIGMTRRFEFAYRTGPLDEGYRSYRQAVTFIVPGNLKLAAGTRTRQTEKEIGEEPHTVGPGGTVNAAKLVGSNDLEVSRFRR